MSSYTEKREQRFDSVRPPDYEYHFRVYSLRNYGDMIADTPRFGAYSEAIAAAVRPGDTVAEIGCGPGVFSMLACRAGARRVYAIESDDIIAFARTLAAANGLSNQIEFMQSESKRAELPERVDVVLSDIRGALPLFRDAIPSLEDARNRFLAPGGIMIPQRDTLKAAVMEAEAYYARMLSPWREPLVGLDLSSAILRLLNQIHDPYFEKSQLLTGTEDWGVLDYTTGAAADVSTEANFCVEREGTGHGVCLWFETNLFDGIGYSARPGTSTVHGQLFLPWLEPVAFKQGEGIQVAIKANLVGRDYVWQWETKIPASSRHGEIHFRQSTFQGANYSLQHIRRTAADYVPALSEAGKADLWMMERMNGSASLQEIAKSTAEQFPRLFSSWQEAFRRVANLSSELSR